MSNNPHNQNFAIYDLIYETRFGPMYQNFTNKSLAVISTILQTGKILDIGCGTGRLTIPLASNKYNVVGVDLNELMLKKDAFFQMTLAFASIINFSNLLISYIHLFKQSILSNSSYVKSIGWRATQTKVTKESIPITRNGK